MSSLYVIIISSNNINDTSNNTNDTRVVGAKQHRQRVLQLATTTPLVSYPSSISHNNFDRLYLCLDMFICISFVCVCTCVRVRVCVRVSAPREEKLSHSAMQSYSCEQSRMEKRRRKKICDCCIENLTISTIDFIKIKIAALSPIRTHDGDIMAIS